MITFRKAAIIVANQDRDIKLGQKPDLQNFQQKFLGCRESLNFSFDRQSLLKGHLFCSTRPQLIESGKHKMANGRQSNTGNVMSI